GNPAASPTSAFAVDLDGAGGACPSPPPFSLTQSTSSSNTGAGAFDQFGLNLVRANGNQYLEQVKTTLPAGVLGAIPSVTLCGEPQAAQGTCSSTSQVGVATVGMGAGPELTLTGPVYLTGPYRGAPFGLSIPIDASRVGPFDYGTIVTRGTVEVDPYTSRLTVNTTLPTIVGGVPLRMRKIQILMNREGFLFNPTNCGVLATETTLTSTLRATQGISTPFQASGCSALPFKPTLTASTGSRVSKANGASIQVAISQPARQANIKSVLTFLPKALPSRLTTIQGACLDTLFNAGNDPPGACPEHSRVGGAVIKTPVIGEPLTGPAYLVSHGGAAFPDLDLILKGGGVRVILVGHIDISSAGITSTDFAALPDVPVTGFSLNLPIGPNSALTGTGNFCSKSLAMPTEIEAQNGAKIKQSTPIVVTGCSVKIVGHKVSGATVAMRVQTQDAGRVSGSGKYLRFTTRHLNRATRATLNVGLSSAGRQALARRHRLTIRLRAGFIPAQRGTPTSTDFTTVVFRG
ncbi:MAG TPA: hypothetical protein VGX16_04680, partial [Solirubrobacteraceae bacterium]|nr:hypothetical protein [Solirubrobacteraceae bacterium]